MTEVAAKTERRVPCPSKFSNVIRYGTWFYPAAKAYANREGITTVFCDKCLAQNLDGALHYDTMDLCTACLREETNKLGRDTPGLFHCYTDVTYSPLMIVTENSGRIQS